MQLESGARLKQLGAQIVLVGIVFMAFAVKVAHPGNWFFKFWPLIGFGVLCIRAVVGIIGFSVSAFENHRHNRAD